MKTQEIKKCIRQGFAWPGGYQIFFVTNDGATLCCDCAKLEYRQIAYAHRHHLSDGWRIEGTFLDCDTDELIACDHCGKVFKEAWAE